VKKEVGRSGERGGWLQPLWMTAMRKEVADSNLYECQPPLFTSYLFLHTKWRKRWLYIIMDRQPPLSSHEVVVARSEKRWLYIIMDRQPPLFSWLPL
jgi:hypothetical protein